MAIVATIPWPTEIKASGGPDGQPLDAPCTHAVVLTKSDTDELVTACRALYVGGTGDVTVVTIGGDTVTFSAVPVGVILPIMVKQLKSTNTSATLIVGIW